MFTVRHLGFKDDYAVLRIPEINRHWAMQVLTRYCHVPSFNKKGEMVHSGYRTHEGLAWCYNGGKFRGKLNTQDEYVQGVMAEMAKRKALAQK